MIYKLCEPQTYSPFLFGLYHNTSSISVPLSLSLQQASIHKFLDSHKEICLPDIAFKSISSSNRPICLEENTGFYQQISILCLFFPKVGETGSYLLFYLVEFLSNDLQFFTHESGVKQDFKRFE